AFGAVHGGAGKSNPDASSRRVRRGQAPPSEAVRRARAPEEVRTRADDPWRHVGPTGRPSKRVVGCSADGAAPTQHQTAEREQTEGRERASAHRAAVDALELTLRHAVERPGGGGTAGLSATEGDLHLLLAGQARG